MDLNRIKDLMGIANAKSNVSESRNVTMVMTAGNGKKYGVVKEGSEYLIKVSESDKETLTESDFSYIGGLQNKRDFVYKSCTIAEKQLRLKVQSINEGVKKSAPVITEKVEKVSLNESTEQIKEDVIEFEKEVLFEGYNGRQAFDVVDTKTAIELLNLVESDFGKESNQYSSLRKFIIENFDTSDLSAKLNETKTHLYNKMLSGFDFIDYAGNPIVESALKLEDEKNKKYKVKLDLPDNEKESEEDMDFVDFDLDDEPSDEGEGFDSKEGEEEEPSNEDPFGDEPFDAGVEADEEEDPKKFIQQLAGKIGQSLRTYTSELESPDFELEKFVINSVISATNTADMSEEDQEDIINKVKESGKGEDNGEVADEMPSDEEMGMDDMEGKSSDAEGDDMGDEDMPKPEGDESVEEGLSSKQSEVMDTDKDGDIDAEDLANLRGESIDIEGKKEEHMVIVGPSGEIIKDLGVISRKEGDKLEDSYNERLGGGYKVLPKEAADFDEPKDDSDLMFGMEESDEICEECGDQYNEAIEAITKEVMSYLK